MQIIMELTLPIAFAGTEPFTRAVTSEAMREVGILERRLLSPTKTWKADNVPNFKKKFSFGGKDWEGFITTTDKPYVWVTDGTKGGAATFSKGFKPKSKVGTLGAGAGAGRVVKRGAGAKPRDTEARNFQETAVKQRTKPFTKNMRKAILVGARRTFRGKKVQVIVL